MKTRILTVLLLFCTQFAMAQQVKGLLTDSEGQIIANASVAIFGTEDKDSTTCVTNASGVFAFFIPSGVTDLTLRISCVGYETRLFALKSIPENGDLGSFEIKEKPVALNEALVTATSLPRVDRTIYYPSATRKKLSNDAYELINKMMLPDVKVSLSNRTISTHSGQTVLLYINDKPAQQSDLLSLRPQNVIKIEHIESPGAEYGYDVNIGSVIKILVKEPETGFIAGVSTLNAITTLYGQNFAYGKLYNKKSAFQLNVTSMYSDVKKRNTTEHLTYQLQEGEHRVVREGLDTEIKYTQNEVEAVYNFTNPNKFIFDISASVLLYDSPERGNRQFITETNALPFYSIASPTEKYHKPMVNAFFKSYLTSRQVLLGNAVYTHTNTDYGYALIESTDEYQNNILSSYSYTTKGHKNSLIAELQYNNQLKNATLALGVRHAYGRTVNKYLSNSAETTKLTDRNTYFYGSLSGWLKNVGYTAGVGLSHLQNSQEGMSSSDWIFKPQFALAAFLGNVRIRYNTSITSTTPSLSQLTNNLLQQNKFEFLTGNPNLSSFYSVYNQLVFGWSIKKFYVQNAMIYEYKNNPIMAELNYTIDGLGNERFTHTYANQKLFQTFRNNISVTYELLKDILELTGSCQYLYKYSRGNNYAHDLSFLSFSIQADLSIKSWSGGISFNSKDKDLDGEIYTINSGSLQTYLNRRIGNIRVGFMFSNIFSKNGITQTDVTKSYALNKSSRLRVPSLRNLFMINFVWNIRKGKQHETIENSFSNKDVDSGILKME